MAGESSVRVEEQALEALRAYQAAKAEYDRYYDEKKRAEQRLLSYMPDGASVIRIGRFAVKRAPFDSVVVLELADPVDPEAEVQG